MKKALLKVASKTSSETIENIKSKFSAYLGETFDWQVVVDCSLIGGFTAYIDGTVYDCTVATKLETMKQALSDTIGRT